MSSDRASHRPASSAKLFSSQVIKQPSLPVAPPLTVPQTLSCGAIARAVQIVSSFPVDTIKTRIQSAQRSMAPLSKSPSSPFSPITSALSKGRLFSGVGVTLLGQVPYGMLTFGLYESLQTYLSRSASNIPNWLRIVLAASIGDAIGSLWLTPSEVVKSKTQTGLYGSPVSTIRSLAATGPLSFYQGYAAAIARDVPFRAVQMLLYDQCRRVYSIFKKRSSNLLTEDVKLTSMENLFVGAVAGTITAIVTTPLDVIRTRMMCQPTGANAIYRNAFDCVVKTVSGEGVFALLKGIGPRAVLVGPSTAVFFATYEACKSFFHSRSRVRSPIANVVPQRCTCSLRRPAVVYT